MRGSSGIPASILEVVTRDRSPTYAAAINEGAPSAVQVADRFHLLMNVREALAEDD